MKKKRKKRQKRKKDVKRRECVVLCGFGWCGEGPERLGGRVASLMMLP